MHGGQRLPRPRAGAARRGENVIATTITISVDILRRTEKALFVSDGDAQVWLPLSQVEGEGEPGDTDVDI